MPHQHREYTARCICVHEINIFLDNREICTKLKKKYMCLWNTMPPAATKSKKLFLYPRHKMAGAYSVTPFCHSVLPDSVSAHYLGHTWRFSNEIWYNGLSREYAGWVRIGSGRIIFGRVMPLGLPLIFTFRSLSPLQIDIFNWNLVYRCVMRICRLSSNFGLVE